MRQGLRGGNVPVIVLDVDMSHYFHIHCTNADTVDKIVPADLGNLTGALASWAYIAAEMPQPLDHAPVTKAP
jgi:hypothetical protein